MSKEDVPGEKRTTSPGCARACARSTASAMETAISHGTTPLQSRQMRSAISPIRMVARTFSANERAERLILEAFVLAARDENDRLRLREERFLDRIEIGRLRIVDVTDTVELADKLEPMRSRLIGAERRHHLRKRKPAREADGERRHQVFDVVRAAQLRFRQAQDRLAAIDDRALRQVENRRRSS